MTLRIERAELLEARLPLAEPFRARNGIRSERRILLLRLEGGGAAGWSECVALEDPGYTGETTDTAWLLLTRYLLPDLPGKAIPSFLSSPSDVMSPFAWIQGHPMARASVEMAAWDLAAKLRGISLAEALGGRAEWVPVGVSVGFRSSTEELLRTVEDHLARGYRRVKVKIEPGRDVETLGSLRSGFGWEIDLLADANGAYRLDDLPRLKELDAFDLLMLEQPLPADDLLGHARLQEALETPLCLDESLASSADVEVALELGACRIVNIKPGRMGGLGAAVRAHDVCLDRGVPLWCGGMLESGVGRAHNLALAGLPGFTLPGDLSESARYWERDLVAPPFVLEDGGLRIPTGPGIGVEPDEAFIREITVRRASF
ncbi:MAG: o-succinylbenzoate synthase [Longimicrobiales bacterium]